MLLNQVRGFRGIAFTSADISVEEYRQKRELLILRVGIKEPRITLVRFQSGLNMDIRDRVELLRFNDLNDLVQLCVKV